jgi:hypothetical protein
MARPSTFSTVAPVAVRAITPLVVAATFIVGFGVAELTGVRALGGVVLVAGGAWCVHVMLRIAGPARTTLLVAGVLALFILSHPLGHAIGPWPAVFISASLAAGMTAVAITHSRRKTDAPAGG